MDARKINNGIMTMPHDGLRDAAERPAAHAGTAVRTHGDQMVRRVGCVGDDFIGAIALSRSDADVDDTGLF